MANNNIIAEIKTATDEGVKLAPALRDRLILRAILELYEAVDKQSSALADHIKAEAERMDKELKDHDKRIENLERHDLISLAFKHPKMALFIIAVVLALFQWGGDILKAFGVVVP